MTFDAEAFRNKVEDFIPEAFEATKHLADVLKDKLEEAGEDLKSGAENLAEKVVEFWESGSIQTVANNIFEEFINKTEIIKNMLSQSNEMFSSLNITEVAIRVGGSLSQIVHEQPLLLFSGVMIIIMLVEPHLLIPLLRMLGFGRSGPVLGSAAALIQSLIYGKNTGGVFAALQSATMTGRIPQAAVVACRAAAIAAVGVVGEALVAGQTGSLSNLD